MRAVGAGFSHGTWQRCVADTASLRAEIRSAPYVLSGPADVSGDRSRERGSLPCERCEDVLVAFNGFRATGRESTRRKQKSADFVCNWAS
jgi:hypothetical protein